MPLPQTEEEIVQLALKELRARQPKKVALWREWSGHKKRPFRTTWRRMKTRGPEGGYQSIFVAVCKFCDDEIVTHCKGEAWATFWEVADYHGRQCAMGYYATLPPIAPTDLVTPPKRTRKRDIAATVAPGTAATATGVPCGFIDRRCDLCGAIFPLRSRTPLQLRAVCGSCSEALAVRISPPPITPKGGLKRRHR